MTATSGLLAQLLAIRAEHGYLDPALVVQVATPEDHPLHHRLEWDDSIAGTKYRRQQAHELIRSVRVVYRDANDQEKSVRALIAMPRPSSPASHYEPVEDVMTDPFKHKLMLQEAERAWRNMRARYNNLAEFRAFVLQDLTSEDIENTGG